MSYRDYSALGRCLRAAATSREPESRTAHRAAHVCAGLLAVMALCSCDHQEMRLVLTKPAMQDTVVARTYACDIHSARRLEIRAQTRGYLGVVNAQEGQSVKEGEVLFDILPQPPGSAGNRRKKEAALTASIKAPFSGRLGRLRKQSGSPVNEGDVLATLSDNSEMTADFMVPEAQSRESSAAAPAEEMKQVRLLLVNGRMFDQPGRVIQAGAAAGHGTGALPFRAVFPNPNDLLRHGETGSIRMESTLKNALLVPRASTFERGDHHFIYVVDKDHVIRQRQISITNEAGDYFVVSDGVSADDLIIFQGMEQVHDGGKAAGSTYEEPAAAYAHLKLQAEQ